MSDKKKIVFVSISCDLYGSSKVLLSLVLQMKQKSSKYEPVVCLPPEDGPLRDRLKEAGVRIIEMPVVKLTRSMLKSFAIFGLLSEYFRAKRIFRRETSGMDIYCIQSNTLATVFGSIYCKFRRTKHIIHVHEIMDRPKLAALFFKYMLKFGSEMVVYNSEATAAYYNKLAPSLRKKSTTIINGVDRTGVPISESEREDIRRDLYNAGPGDVIIGLVGRINRLKGHDITLDIFEELVVEYPELCIRFVGSPPPNQEHFLVNLRERIDSMEAGNRVQIVDFRENVFPLMEAMDLVVVPSTEPESFGLVVVEAMLSGKAVVGSDIGGISTIIDPNRTGLLFDPKDKESYKRAVKKLLDDNRLKQKMETEALQVAKTEFTTQKMYHSFLEVYDKNL